MAGGYKEGDYVIVRQHTLSGTTSDELTRVFKIERFEGGSMAYGHLVRQGPSATQSIDWQDEIERRADDREVMHASTTGRA